MTQLISFPKHQELSRSVDLRPWMSLVEQQGDWNTCAANAVAGVCKYLFKRYSHREYNVSRLFIYYNGQVINQESYRVKDLGVPARDIILGMREYGLCQERVWPYDKNFLNRRPQKSIYDQARRYTVVPLHIPCNIKAIETCLHNNIPIPIDIVLLDHAGTAIRANHGILPLPDLNNPAINNTQVHTVLLVGYNRDKQCFIVRNSYGKDWGYRGYFYMPYAYLYNQRLHHPQDGLWTIVKITPRTDGKPPVCQLAM